MKGLGSNVLGVAAPVLCTEGVSGDIGSGIRCNTKQKKTLLTHTC